MARQSIGLLKTPVDLYKLETGVDQYGNRTSEWAFFDRVFAKVTLSYLVSQYASGEKRFQDIEGYDGGDFISVICRKNPNYNNLEQGNTRILIDGIFYDVMQKSFEYINFKYVYINFICRKIVTAVKDYN